MLYALNNVRDAIHNLHFLVKPTFSGILQNVGFVIKKDYIVITTFCDVYVAHFARSKVSNMTT